MLNRPKGGMRPGAGRPAGNPTKVVRLPVPIADMARRIADRSLKAGNVGAFLTVDAQLALCVPLVSSSVAAGFPSPADDHLDRPLDFNELLIENPAATFAVRISGESMLGAGIFPNDIAIVDRSRKPVSGCIVLALLDGEFTVKRYRVKGGRVVLQAENKEFPDIVVGEEAVFEVWGVVRKSIRML
jgi:DNA polymerase V